MWMLFKKHFRKALVGDLGYDYTDANRITKAAKIKCREIIEKLPEFEKEDRFMTNMATKIFCRMGGKKKFTDSDIEGMKKTVFAGMKNLSLSFRKMKSLKKNRSLRNWRHPLQTDSSS